MVITGDITQIDLPSKQKSRLVHAIQMLSIIDDINFNFFNQKDSIDML